VRILIDTHVFLWMNDAVERLSPRARALLEDRSNTPVLSTASVWEMAVKSRLGKLDLAEAVAVYIPTRVAHYGIEVLPIGLAHALAVGSLPSLHHDPFDRLLIAQSRVEGIPLLTSDAQIHAYGGKMWW
jgi:PIN domain nuclease of toxin-antitoxin system